MPSLEERSGIVAAFAQAIRPLGPATPPGLHVLCRRCTAQSAAMDAAGLSIALDAEQNVILAASVPLSAEPGWRALDEGELIVAQRGELVTSRRRPADAPPHPPHRALSP